MSPNPNSARRQPSTATNRSTSANPRRTTATTITRMSTAAFNQAFWRTLTSSDAHAFNLNRFRQLTAGLFVCVAGGVHFGFGVFSQHIKEKAGFSQTDMTTISTVGTSMYKFTLLAGTLFDWVGPQYALFAGMLVASSGFVLLALVFNDFVSPTLATIAIANVMINWGTSFFDSGAIMPMLFNFPISKGDVVIIEKTFLGLGSTFFALMFDGMFMATHDYTGYAIFAAVFVLVTVSVAVYLIRLPPYKLTSRQQKAIQKMLPHQKQIAQRVQEVAFERYHNPRLVDRRRLNYGICCLIVTVTFFMVLAFLKSFANLSQSVVTGLTVVAILCLLSFIGMTIPAPFPAFFDFTWVRRHILCCFPQSHDEDEEKDNVREKETSTQQYGNNNNNGGAGATSVTRKSTGSSSGKRRAKAASVRFPVLPQHEATPYSPTEHQDDEGPMDRSQAGASVFLNAPVTAAALLRHSVRQSARVLAVTETQKLQRTGLTTGVVESHPLYDGPHCTGGSPSDMGAAGRHGDSAARRSSMRKKMRRGMHADDDVAASEHSSVCPNDEHHSSEDPNTTRVPMRASQSSTATNNNKNNGSGSLLSSAPGAGGRGGTSYGSVGGPAGGVALAMDSHQRARKSMHLLEALAGNDINDTNSTAGGDDDMGEPAAADGGIDAPDGRASAFYHPDEAAVAGGFTVVVPEAIDPVVIPGIETSFLRSIASSAILWLLFYVSFAVHGSAGVFVNNVVEIVTAINDGEPATNIAALNVALIGVGSAFGRIFIGIAEMYVHSRNEQHRKEQLIRRYLAVGDEEGTGGASPSSASGGHAHDEDDGGEGLTPATSSGGPATTSSGDQAALLLGTTTSPAADDASPPTVAVDPYADRPVYHRPFASVVSLLFVPPLCMALAGFSGVVLPTSMLFVTFLLALTGSGSFVAISALSVREIFHTDVAKHYNFVTCAGIISTIVLNRFMFGTWYDYYGTSIVPHTTAIPVATTTATPPLLLNQSTTLDAVALGLQSSARAFAAAGGGGGSGLSTVCVGRHCVSGSFLVIAAINSAAVVAAVVVSVLWLRVRRTF